MIALRDLQQYVVLAEELNFRAAADRLHVAQPTLSQTLARLEKQLGTSLIARTTRRSHLTAAGQALFDGAVLLLSDAHALEREVQHVGAGRRRQLRVGAVNPAMRDLVPSALKSVIREFPDVGVSLHPMSTNAMRRALREGRIDVAVARISRVMDGFRGAPLMNDPLVAILPAGHRLAKRSMIAIKDLDGETFIMAPRSRNPEFHDELVSLYRRRGCSPARLEEVSGVHSQLAMIGAGVGISVQTILYADPGRHDVAFVPVGERLRIPLQVLTPDGDDSDVRALFVDAARRRAREMIDELDGA